MLNLGEQLKAMNERLLKASAEALAMTSGQVDALKTWVTAQQEGQGGDDTLLKLLLGGLGIGVAESVRRNAKTAKAIDKLKPAAA